MYKYKYDVSGKDSIPIWRWNEMNLLIAISEGPVSCLVLAPPFVTIGLDRVTRPV